MYFSLLNAHSIHSVLSPHGTVFGAIQVYQPTSEHVTMTRLSANSRLRGNSTRFESSTR